MIFKIGQKVVYVGGGWKSGNAIAGATGPKVGGIYTIRGFVDVWIPFCGCPGIVTEECVNAPVLWCGALVEPALAASSFRPLIERKTDTGMAILRKVADDAAKRKNLVVTG